MTDVVDDFRQHVVVDSICLGTDDALVGDALDADETHGVGITGIKFDLDPSRFQNLEFDVGKISYQVALPPSPGNVKPVSAVALSMVIRRLQ